MLEVEVKGTIALLEALGRMYDRHSSEEYWYRGQPDASKSLVPSLHRCYSRDDERQMNRTFMRLAPERYPRCPADDRIDEWMCLMRHYGLPTRLLDWTESPLIAAFFAVSLGVNGAEADAVVWMLSPARLNAAFGFEDRVWPMGSAAARTLLAPAFEEAPEPPAPVLAVEGKVIDPRMSFQLSKFTIHGEETPLETRPGAEMYLSKFVIPARSKPDFRVQLWQLGIRPSTIFHDIEHLADDVLMHPRFVRRGVGM